MARKTHQVVDFGPGPIDSRVGYPFEGTEVQCSDWIDQRQETRDGRDRYALQQKPE
jgi:hypothetical protein